MAHTSNPSYLGGRDQEDRGLRPAQANSLWDPPISKNNQSKIVWRFDSSSRVPALQGLEFKPQSPPLQKKMSHKKESRDALRANTGRVCPWATIPASLTKMQSSGLTLDL
jgi:hypothetical protein